MLKDQVTAKKILEMLKLSQKAAEEMYKALESGNNSAFLGIANDIVPILSTLTKIGYNLEQQDSTINLGKSAESCLYSLTRIMQYDNPERSLHKTEFELIPLLEEAYIQFYFWGCVYPDKSRMEHFHNVEFFELCKNKYIDKSAETGIYKYDLTIQVTAYNKLEYTKNCVQSILDNIPPNLNYELILINHGSSDQTQEYFESINPTKQIDIIKNGGGRTAYTRIVEAKYLLSISNDVIITKNTITNLLDGIMSDKKIARVVPSTPNVSNLQAIPSNYSDMEEMFEFASENNQYNVYRHELRTRLCDPLAIHNSELQLASRGLGLMRSLFLTDSMASFPDDAMSLLIRRNSFKNILAKDTYCYHYGSVTIQDDLKNVQQQDAYLKGRQDFLNWFGVNPWGTGFCYDPDLVSIIKCGDFEHVDILGINCGLGSNSLKVKEMYREIKHNLDVTLYNLTDNKIYEQDLKGVSDEVRIVDKPRETFFSGPKLYHHIVIDDMFTTSFDYVAFLKNCLHHLHDGGSLFFKSPSLGEKLLADNFPGATTAGEWSALYK